VFFFPQFKTGSSKNSLSINSGTPCICILNKYLFSRFSGTAPIVPFIPTLAKQLGFSPVTVGTMYTFLPIFGLLAKPLFGAISDRFKVQKVLFLSFIVLTAATFYGILYIPTATRENQVGFPASHDQIYRMRCDKSDLINPHTL
jgi:Nitrate/nitrite transporter